MSRKPTCRYGKNGYFGICECDECRRIVVITDEMRMDYLSRDEPGLRGTIDGIIRAEILKKRGLA